MSQLLLSSDPVVWLRGAQTERDLVSRFMYICVARAQGDSQSQNMVSLFSYSRSGIHTDISQSRVPIYRAQFDRSMSLDMSSCAPRRNQQKTLHNIDCTPTMIFFHPHSSGSSHTLAPASSRQCIIPTDTHERHCTPWDRTTSCSPKACVGTRRARLCVSPLEAAISLRRACPIRVSLGAKSSPPRSLSGWERIMSSEDLGLRVCWEIPTELWAMNDER